MLDFFGPDQVLFGSDMPLGGPRVTEATIADLESLSLPEQDLAKLFSGNAAHLLGVGGQAAT